MNQPIDNELLSMFVDGELDNKQTVELLQEVLDDKSACTQLKKLLKLRQAFGQWREQGDELPIEESNITPSIPSEVSSNRFSLMERDWGQMLITALLGGVLVLGGILATQHGQKQNRPVVIVTDKTEPEEDLKNQKKPQVGMQQYQVKKSEQQQIAQVFAFQESVAGPLNWYGADNESIQLKTAPQGKATGSPLAIMLHLKGKGFDKNYTIVCRDHVPVDVKLPQFLPHQKPLKIQIRAVWHEGKVHLQYALVVEAGSQIDGPDALLVGKRHLGLEGVRLGQFTLENRLFSVDANAWRIDHEPTL